MVFFFDSCVNIICSWRTTRVLNTSSQTHEDDPNNQFALGVQEPKSVLRTLKTRTAKLLGVDAGPASHLHTDGFVHACAHQWTPTVLPWYGASSLRQCRGIYKARHGRTSITEQYSSF